MLSCAELASGLLDPAADGMAAQNLLHGLAHADEMAKGGERRAGRAVV